MEYPHLSNAPIVEAVVDFRVKLPPDFKIESFNKLCETLKTQYPRFEQQQQIQHTFRKESEKPPEISTRMLGLHSYQLRSEDEKNVVQLRRDGFTFSRLTPYSKWEDLYGEAWRLWRLYVDAAKPLELSRIAVRYINRLLLPLPIIDPSEYMNAPPVVAEGWPANMSAFLTRVVLHEPESEIFINVIQAAEPLPPGEQTHIPVLFDIDAYQESLLSADDVTLTDRFGRLREMKNRVFFKGITPKAIELFR